MLKEKKDTNDKNNFNINYVKKTPRKKYHRETSKLTKYLCFSYISGFFNKFILLL